MRSKAGMKFDCIFEEPLDFIDIDYTQLNSEIEKSKSEIVPDYRDEWRLREGEKNE